MTPPENPQDPQKGKPDQDKVAEEAKDAKVEATAEAEAQPEPKPKPKRAKPKKTEETAAEETGVDKAAAAAEVTAEPGEEPKPKPRRTRAKKTEEAPQEEPVAEEPVAEAPPEAAPARRRDRRQPAEPGVSVRAQAKYVRTSARKARLVCDHIRGKDVVEARAILAYTPRSAAKPWLKLLESAVANAEHNHELVGDDLRITAVHADEGPTLKRYRPRAMGRATRIRKRTSHLTITLTPKES
jgi:ribosomal protein L22